MAAEHAGNDGGEAKGMKEFTLRAVVCGLVFGVVFGAANVYLGLKAGLTVSTSIPIAVLAVAVFRALGAKRTMLEANIAQTVGSASSSLASGTIFTIPALFIWGAGPSIPQVAGLAVAGGLLGIFAMVPLRRLLIVKSEAELPFPEGRACAEVIRASEGTGVSGRWIFIGLGIGIAVKLLISAVHAVPDELSVAPGFLPGAVLALKISPALIAVGFIVGFRSAAVMVSGSLITALVLRPLMVLLHATGRASTSAPVEKIADGALGEMIRYVGAGAVAAAGLITIAKTAPMMARSLAAVVRGVRGGDGTGGGGDRKDRDLPGGLIVAGLAAIVLFLAAVPGVFAGDLPFGGRLVAALGVLVFGLVFVPVSSRLVGVIGVSSNPTSAMALITLIGTAGVFIAVGYGGLEARATVLTVGTVVCIAASKAGDISQDLKTGQLLGGTPALQQFGQLIAAAVSCWVVAAVVVAIGRGPEGFTGPDAIAAPQARLMATVVDAVLGGNLPWDLVLSGASLGGIGALAGLPPLPFALGIYLPLSTMAAIFVGGVVRRLTGARDGGKGDATGAGVLCASGFVAGEGLAGVLVAAHAFLTEQKPYKAPPPDSFEIILGLAAIALAVFVLARAERKKPPSTS